MDGPRWRAVGGGVDQDRLVPSRNRVEQGRTGSVETEHPDRLRVGASLEHILERLGHPPADLIVAEGRSQSDQDHRLRLSRRKWVAHEMQGS